MHFSLTIFTHLFAKYTTIISYMWITLSSPFFIDLQQYQSPFGSLSIPNSFPLSFLHKDWFFCLKYQSLPQCLCTCTSHTHTHTHSAHTYTHAHTYRHTMHIHLLWLSLHQSSRLNLNVSFSKWPSWTIPC